MLQYYFGIGLENVIKINKNLQFSEFYLNRWKDNDGPKNGVKSSFSIHENNGPCFLGTFDSA